MTILPGCNIPAVRRYVSKACPERQADEWSEPTLKGFKVSWPPWNILLMAGFFFPLARLSIGSNTLMVVERAEVRTEHTKCRPSPMPALKKFACPWIFFGRRARAFWPSVTSSASIGYELSVLLDKTRSN